MLTRPRTGATIVPEGLLEFGKLYTLAELNALGAQPKGTQAYTTDSGLVISDGSTWAPNGGGDVTTAQLTTALADKVDTATIPGLEVVDDQLLLNGQLIGGGDGGAFDPTGTGLVSTTQNAAIAELKTLIDQINAILE